MSAGPLQMQYADLAQQRDTAELGIWAFLATEVLFLGGLFAAYSFYRYLHPYGVAEAARHTYIAIGATNSVILLASSFVMSWAALAVQGGAMRLGGRLMMLVAGLGVLFVVLKGVEYAGELSEHLWPGPSFAIATDEPRVGEVFYAMYWLLTGVHALHLMIGVIAVVVIGRRVLRGAFSRDYHVPVRVVSLYWHFVDVVWIFLFVIIYLPGRHL